MRILVMSDIHIGSIKDCDYVYNAITSIFDKEIKFNKCDMVVITGDYFHRLFKVNEEYTSLAINVMSYLVNLCKLSKTSIRIVYGTESHEMNQYKLFNYHVNSKNIDFKVIKNASNEVFNGNKILYLPEEYVNNDDVYKKLMNEEYDYIFGHGVIKEGMSHILKLSGKQDKSSRYIKHFNADNLGNISKICIFGHYHTYTDMGNNVYYLGSLFRNSFGEEEDKGYGIIDGNGFTFINNEDTMTFKTYTFNEDSDIYTDIETMTNKINDIKNENNDILNGIIGGGIRIICHIPNIPENTFKESLINLINADSNIRHISLIIKDVPQFDVDEKISVSNEYEFILNKDIDIGDKIFKYINTTFDNIDMDLASINKYINDDVSKF